MGEGGRMKQWLAAMETSVLVMGLLRLFSGSAEIFAALLMLYVNDAESIVYKWYVGVCWTDRINFNNDNRHSECGK